MKKLHILPALILLTISLGAEDIRTDIREVDHQDYAVKMKNEFWEKILFKLLSRYDSDRTGWRSGYISFDLALDDFIYTP